MKIEYFLFGIYLLFIIWYIPKISFVKRSALTRKEVRFLLAFKIISGLICAYYFEKITANADYLFFNAEGQTQFELLLSNPGLFFSDLTNDLHTYGPGGLFESKDSFWAYVRFNLVYKFIAILNLVTRGNFYFNTTVFCSLVFFGHMAFYRLYSEMYKGNKLAILFPCFGLPSVLFYTSCINKDGIVYVSLGLISFIFYRILRSSRFINIKYILLFMAAMSTVFLIRNYLVIALVPAMVTALLCKFLPYRKRLVLLTSYLFFSLLFFLSGFKTFLNLPAAVIQRKADFALINDAKTNIPMNELYPTVQSFAFNLPQAVNHSLFRPYLWEFAKPAIILAAMELFFYQLIIIAFIFFRKKGAIIFNNFNLFGFAFFINMILIIGYAIPNIGAIVRYRSIFWVFLLCPLVCSTDWKRLLSFRKPATNIV